MINFFDSFGSNHIIPKLVIMVVIIVTHELIHGLTWMYFTNNGFNSIKFGIKWNYMIPYPYCQCKEILYLKHYKLGVIMPAIILGFIPSFISLITGNLALLYLGVFGLMTAAGDFMIFNLIKKENGNTMVLDHPDRFGCYLFIKNE